MVEMLNEKISLATNLRDSNMFSEKWIYENVFGMSQVEWTAEQDQVIEDLKTQFRREQIKSEGNDPKKTNMSFGTPHDIASMHVATKGELLPGMEQQHVGGTGRPEEPGTWGTHASPHGRDPLAIKDLSASFNTDKSPLTVKPRGGSPLSLEHKEMQSFVKSLNFRNKSPEILKESIGDGETVSMDKGTLLDESQLIDDEKS
jgi:hypothetical protein